MGRVVVLQFGQGGIQLGFSFLEALARLGSANCSPNDFFRDPPRPGDPAIARTVLIDTEPKVVASVKRRVSSKKCLWRYGPHSTFTENSGSGNNWANGYCKYGPTCQDNVMDLIRREVEKCDILSGFVSLQSLAGGTGSGLGAYISEIVRDEYPSACILNHCIWPLEGEVSLQYYNALLSLAHMQSLTDGIIFANNESLLSTCKKVLNIQRPSFDDMNDVATRSLASVLLPAYHCDWTRDSKQTHGKAPVSKINDSPLTKTSVRFRPLPDLASTLCAHPKYHMLTIHATPQIPASQMKFTPQSWKSHLKQLKWMMYVEPVNNKEVLTTRNKQNQNPNPIPHKFVDRCLANLLVLRGNSISDADVSFFDDKSLYPLWSVDPLTVKMHPAHLGGYDMFAGVVSNCYSAIAPASDALSKANTMYASKAFVHQFLNHGLEREAFETSFETVEDIVARYQAL